MHISYTLAMRPSPLRHPLAILRTTIGLTQKEMAGLVHRAARTIQAVELGKLPLSEDLAMLIAQATGVDAGWLLENNPAAAPRKGTTAMGMGSGTGEFTRADFEFHRAFIESPAATSKEMQGAYQAALKLKTSGEKIVTMPLPILKTALLAKKKSMMQTADQVMLNNLKTVLDHTVASASGDLIRWKLRQFLKTLAAEFHVPLNQPAASEPAMMHIAVKDIPGDKPATKSTKKKASKSGKP
jgi:transcriptional regulator with XRE-family HTH domain